MNLQQDIVYLLACALNGTKADDQRLQKMNLDTCYTFALRHNIASMIFPAIEGAKNTNTEKWNQAFENNVRRNMLFDTECAEVYKFFNKNKIWYLPMKGILLQEMYPVYGMRHMADHDILFDQNSEDVLCQFMEARGYTAHDESLHVKFQKKPLYNFEMHRELMSKTYPEQFYEYCQQIENRMLKDGNLRKLTNEDLYIYQTLHGYKHFVRSGWGLKQLTDTYIMTKKFNLNFEHLTHEFTKLGIAEFEQNLRRLVKKLFSDPEKPKQLTRSEADLFVRFFKSAAYGTKQHNIDNKLRQFAESPGSMKKYFFPSFETVQTRWIKNAKYKVLLPVYWLRVYKIYLKSGSITRNIKTFVKYRKKNRKK